ncbi:hypothetical protein P692DRAFT_201474084 [Suillus brevipes Sb2]|nr:hypothetical protein P692DRAFT_201474084 [Suillus brevipes Sb2]
MAQLGLTSMLSPDPPLLHQNTANSGNSVEIIRDSRLPTQHYSQGPLRPNPEDAQRPPSLSPTTWSFTAHEVEGHHWPPTNYLFVPPSLLRCRMSPTTKSRRNRNNITVSFLFLTTWSRRPLSAARTCIYAKFLFFSSPSCNCLDLFLSLYFSYRHVLSRQCTACDLWTHLSFIDMYSTDIGLLMSFATCRHNFPLFHSMDSLFPSTIYLFDNVSIISYMYDDEY